ncbi:MAG: hypothetical protein KA144_05715 [Xanthomonadaceae bacterium]|nr:hypothetical protein [Xanthomonadaceae bacterium]
MTRRFAASCVPFALLLCAALAGCSKPKVPEQDVPPAPQSDPAASTASAAAAAQSPTTLNEAIHQPIDDAKAIRKATEDAATEQRRAIDEATSE